MARPERFELPTTWFVAKRSAEHLPMFKLLEAIVRETALRCPVTATRARLRRAASAPPQISRRPKAREERPGRPQGCPRPARQPP